MQRRVLALVVASVASCATPPVALDGTPTFERSESPAELEGTLAMHWVHRDVEDAIDDAVGGALWVAWGPWRSIVTPQLEAGLGYSQHRVAGFRSDKLEIHRLGAGAKLVLGGAGFTPLAVWARAGWYYRWSWDPDFDEAAFERTGGGRYFGVGIDWISDDFRIGPTYEIHRDDGDGFEERFYGLSISFSH